MNANGNVYDLMEFDKPVNAAGPYMILYGESLDHRYARSIHVLTPDAVGLQYKLGRGHEAAIKVNDLTVSRVHALITYRAEGFVLEDNDSKFGTLLKLNGKQEVTIGRQLSVQISKSVLTFAIRSNRLSSSAIPSYAKAEEAVRAGPVAEK